MMAEAQLMSYYTHDFVVKVSYLEVLLNTNRNWLRHIVIYLVAFRKCLTKSSLSFTTFSFGLFLALLYSMEKSRYFKKYKQRKYCSRWVKATCAQFFVANWYCIQLFGVACDRPPVLIVMEFCHGGNLEDFLKKMGDSIEVGELLEYSFEVCPLLWIFVFCFNFAAKIELIQYDLNLAVSKMIAIL